MNVEEIADRVVIDPDVMVGKPVIKGTRIPVFLIVEFIAKGMTESEVLKGVSAAEKRRCQSRTTLHFGMS